MKNTIYLLLILISLIICSCQDVINVKLNNEDLNLYGVEASITPQDGPEVFLYQTLQVNMDEAYPGISGAVVTITDDSTPVNQAILTEDPGNKGHYRVTGNTVYPGIPGKEYTLTIKVNNVTLQAKDQLSKVATIDSIQVEPSLRGDKRFLGLFIYGKETLEEGNYYKWDVYVNDTLINNAQRMAIASDAFFDGHYLSKLEIYTDYYEKSNAAKDRKLKLNDTVYVNQTSISEFAYNYYFQMINQASNGSLFSVPPANIKSNFTSSDGKPVLGLFVARDISISNKVIITKALVDQLAPL